MGESLYSRDADAIGNLQKLRFFPLAITGGRGTRLVDETGRELLDFSATWGAASLGYGHSAIVEAVYRSVANPPGASILSAVSEPAVELAERLLESFPSQGTHKVWFGHSGSDANEAAYRAIVKATGRTGVIAFNGAYHGCTVGSMAFSGHSVQADATKADGLILLPYPDRYRPFENDPTGNAVLTLLEERLAAAPVGSIAAAFIEPIQSDGGLIVPPDGFLRKFAEICRAHDILVVCDEVKVGLARSGRFHCFEHEGFMPDVLVLGKGLGGGLPLSAVVAPSEILDCASSFAMQTLHGNPVCTTAGLAVLETLDAEGLVAAVDKKGRLLHQLLSDLGTKHPIIGDVRGRGFACGVELVRDRETREPARAETAKLIYRAFELGLVLYYVGIHGNVLEITPPLTMSESDIHAAVGILDRALAEYASVSDETVSRFSGW